MDYITTFERLAIYKDDLFDSFFKNASLMASKKAIRAHVIMQHPTTCLEAWDRAREVKMVINTQTKRPSFPTHTMSPMAPTPNTSNMQLLQIQKSLPKAMVKHQYLNICHNYDERYC